MDSIVLRLTADSFSRGLKILCNFRLKSEYELTLEKFDQTNSVCALAYNKTMVKKTFENFSLLERVKNIESKSSIKEENLTMKCDLNLLAILDEVLTGKSQCGKEIRNTSAFGDTC